MHIMRWSLLSAPAEPFSGYAMMPGVIFGLYASIIISGNPHGGETAPLLIVASIVNFFFWTMVCYAALAVYRRLSKKRTGGTHLG